MATEKEPSGRSTSMSILSRFSRSRARLRASRQAISPNRRGWRPSVRFLVTDMVGIEIDLLIDRADAERARVAGRIDLDRAAVDADFALVAAAPRRS